MTHEAIIIPAEYRTEITENQFEEAYSALTNHLNPDAAWQQYLDLPGRLFEAYGPERRFILDQNPAHVWSLTEGDGDEFHLVSGRVPNNRFGYLVTAEAVPEGERILVRIAFCEDLWRSRICLPRSPIA